LCEKWRGAQKEKGRVRKALFGGSIPPRASTCDTSIQTGRCTKLDNEGGDSAVIRIVQADSENIYRVGIRKVFELEDDIRVIAQADTLAGLHGAIQHFPTDAILLVEGKLIASTVDAIPELVRRAPKLKIIVKRNKEIAYQLGDHGAGDQELLTQDLRQVRRFRSTRACALLSTSPAAQERRMMGAPLSLSRSRSASYCPDVSAKNSSPRPALIVEDRGPKFVPDPKPR
jgi:hypothetical protein